MSEYALFLNHSICSNIKTDYSFEKKYHWKMYISEGQIVYLQIVFL